MSLAELAAREAVLKTLVDEIGTQLKTVRAEVQAELDASAGVRQVAATLPGGQLVAKISLTDPAPEATVTDSDAYLAWVRDQHPAGQANITRHLVTEVRPAFTTALLAELTAAGVPEWCDEDGVVHTVPGVEIRATRARTHSVRFDKGGRDAVMAAWRAGQLTAEVLPELTAGGAE